MMLALARSSMNGFTVQQFAGLLLSASMILIGYLGLTGTVTTHSVLTTAILVAIAVLSFSLGLQSAELKNT